MHRLSSYTLNRYARFSGALFFALTSALYAADEPFALEATDDTFLSSEHTGKPAGRGEKDELQLYGRTDHTFYRALVKFDLRQAPPGFRSAILRLTCWNSHWTETKVGLLRAYPLTSAWNEANASWDQATGASNWKRPGGDWSPQGLAATRMYGPFGGEIKRAIDLDLSAAARMWQANPAQNHGVALMLEKGCLAELRFRSKQYNDASARPRLLLYYRGTPPKDFGWLEGKDCPPCEPYDPDAPAVTLARLPGELKLNEPFEFKLGSTGGKPPHAFGPAGALPPGLSLAADGTIKGKPSRAGTFIFGASCAGSDGKRATEWLRWSVTDPKAPPPKRPDPPAVPAAKSAAPAGEDAPKTPAAAKTEAKSPAVEEEED